MSSEGEGSEQREPGRFRPVSWPVLLTLVVAVLVWRSHELLLRPTMRVEDGAKIFAFFHDHRGLEHVLRFKSGYMPLIPNLLGYLAVRLPPLASPYFMALAPTALSVLAYTSFFATPFRALLPDDRFRFAICLVLALAPVGQFLLVSHTDYSIWNALFCAVLWSWVPLPASPGRAAAAVLGQQLLVWSHPLSFVAAPINAWQVWRAQSRSQRLGQGAMLIGHVMHLAFGLEGSTAARALDPAVGELALRLVKYEIRFLARALLGPAAFGWLRHPAPSVRTLVAVAAVALAVWVVARNVARLRTLVVLAGYSATGIMLGVLASKSNREVYQGIRYSYVQSLFAVLLLCALSHALIHTIRSRKASTWSRAISSPALSIGFLLLVFGAHNVGATRRYEERSRGDNARRVARCMERLATLQAEHGGPCGFSLTCDKTDDWDIVIRPRKCRRR